MRIYTTLRSDSMIYAHEIALQGKDEARLTIIGQNERGIINGMLVFVGTKDEFIELSNRCLEAANSKKEESDEPHNDPGF